MSETFPTVATEKTWVLIHEGSVKLAVCFVYMAAEITGNTEFKDWNEKLYANLQSDLDTLTGKGYESIFMGDFNGHVGNGQTGVEGNHESTNFNGRLLINFIENNGLRMINADKNKTSEIFTRSAGGYATLLDYALASPLASHWIQGLEIDVEGNILGGSDHAGMVLYCKLPQKREPKESSDSMIINLPKKPDYAGFHTKLDRAMDEVDWIDLSLEDHCVALQKVILDAGKEEFGEIPRSRPRPKHASLPKKTKRLRLSKKKWEAMAKRKAVQIAIHRARREPVSRRAWRQALHCYVKAKNLTRQLEAEHLKTSIRLRNRMRAKTKMGSKEFWKLARRVAKKSSNITAVEDKNGNLVTDRKLLEETVLEELTDIYRGQKSKIFSHKGQQLINHARMMQDPAQDEWIHTERQDTCYEDEVCAEASVQEIKRMVTDHKDSRASGSDGIPTQLFKNASQKYYIQVTALVNACLSTGETPESLNSGKMTLIDKKEASLSVNKKRPLTVSSILQSVLTKLLSKRMGKICERENFYGDTQYGFRAGKSTTDCILLLLAAVRKARRKKYKISVAFCDLQKAYDTVDRDILYKKLNSIGFGGRILSMIQSMYYNDNVRVNLGARMTAPLWFTRGVKQGCCLSPLLFSLYISGLGIRIQETQLGIKLGGVIMSGIFFADDLILISRTSMRGITTLLNIVDRFCGDMHMKLAVSKTFLLTTGPRGKNWKVGSNGDSLTETIMAKYLGVNIQLRGRNLVGREKDMVATAKKYAYSIFNIARTGLDRSKLARTLWESCAIPSILYATEAFNVSNKTVKSIDKIQCTVGNFILQTPSSTSKVATWCDAGLMPIGYRIMIRKARYVWRSINKNRDPLVLQCMGELAETGRADAWMAEIINIEELLGATIPSFTLRQLRKTLEIKAAMFVLKVKQQHESTRAMPQPRVWFKLQEHVDDSLGSMTLNQARGGNLKLGNRMPSKEGKQWKVCPFCEPLGITARLSEAHVILQCEATKQMRDRLRISSYIQERRQQELMTEIKVLRDYLGQDGACVAELRTRGWNIYKLTKHWKNVTKEL